MYLKRISRSVVLLLVFTAVLAGCPTAELTPSTSDAAGIASGVYAGTIEVETGRLSASEGISVAIADDGTVSVNGASYNLGDVITDTFVDGTTVVRVIGEVVRTSNSILIRYVEEWTLASGLVLVGNGSTLLTRIDERSLRFEDTNCAFEVNPPDGLEPIESCSESAGVLAN